MIYPHTLKSDWYAADVYDYLFSSLEGAKKWYASAFSVECERNAFLDTFETCQMMCKKHYNNPDKMLQSLIDIEDDLKLLPKPFFFSTARWVYDPMRARKVAVKCAGQIAEGVLMRFMELYEN